MSEILRDGPTEVTGGNHTPIVPQRSHEARHVTGRRRDVDAARVQRRVAKAPLIGHDHLESGFGQRLDVPPEDPFRRRPTVNQEER